MFWAGPVRGWA